MINPSHEDDGEFLVELVSRRPVFRVLDRGPASRRELEDRLDISRSTCHRIVRSFEDKGLIARSGDRYELTGVGQAVCEAINRFARNVDTATDLGKLLNELDRAGVTVDLDAFAGATITRARPSDPYRPVSRFMQLLQQSSTLRTFDKTAIPPPYVDEIAQQVIEDGLTVEAIYEREVATRLFSGPPQSLRAAVESGQFVVEVHPEIPFGICILDDRIGVRAHSPESGADTVFVDTDDTEAYAWAEKVFRSYRAEARQLADINLGSVPDWVQS